MFISWMHHIGMVLFLGVLLVSVIGWGAWLQRLLRMHACDSWPMQASLGLSLMIFLGGLLNLASMVSRITILSLVVAGVAMCIGLYRTQIAEFRFRQLKQFANFRTLILLSVASLMIGAHVFYAQYHPIDDDQAYTALPVKMLEKGELGWEPFGTRRLTGSIGGIYFLQAMVLAVGDIFYLHMIDPALAMLILLGMIHAELKRGQVDARWRCAVLVFTMLYAPYIINLSAFVSLGLFMISILLVFRSDAGKHSFGDAMVVGIFAGALLTLKQVVFPMLGLFLASVYLIRMLRTPRKIAAWLQPVVAFVAMVLVALPWMIAQLRDTGTLLYPLLGKGWIGPLFQRTATAAGNVKPVVPAKSTLELLLTGVVESLASVSLLICLVFVGVIWFFDAKRSREDRFRAVELGLFVSSALAGNLIIYCFAGSHGFQRYSFTQEWIALIAVVPCLAISLARNVTQPSSVGVARIGNRMWMPCLATVLCIAALAANSYVIKKYLSHGVFNLGMAILGPDFRPKSLYGQLRGTKSKTEETIHAIQNAIPRNQRLLAATVQPFLFDFRQQQVLIIDMPGGASLPPGMPFFEGSKALKAFLVSHGIRYVAVDYNTEQRQDDISRLRKLEAPAYQKMTKFGLDFFDNVSELKSHNELLYDDGKWAVIDLAPQQE